jgi:hypothetical protein
MCIKEWKQDFKSRREKTKFNKNHEKWVEQGLRIPNK